MKNFLAGLITGALIIGTSFAEAQISGGAGNGGKAIYCPADRSYSVLDYIRAPMEFNLTPLTEVEGATALDKAIRLVGRIAELNPSRAKKYIQDLLAFEAQQKWVDDGEMPLTPDSNEIIYCKGGEVEQVIVQITPKTPFQKRYITHRARFNRLTQYQQALLMVHEVILKETSALGFEDADRAASMNSYIFSEELSSSSRDTYIQMLKASGLYITYTDSNFGTSFGRVSIVSQSLDFIKVDCTRNVIEIPRVASGQILKLADCKRFNEQLEKAKNSSSVRAVIFANDEYVTNLIEQGRN